MIEEEKLKKVHKRGQDTTEGTVRQKKTPHRNSTNKSLKPRITICGARYKEAGFTIGAKFSIQIIPGTITLKLIQNATTKDSK